MDPGTLAAHAGTISVGLTIAVAAYYTIKAVTFLIAATVAIFTKDEKRREACLEIVRAVCRGWPWLPRQSGSEP